MQKGFAPLIIILGILVILGIAGGAFYLGRSTTPKPSPNPAVTSQTPPASTPQPSLIPDETANWKTYTNNSLGFSFKYPANWSIVEQPNYVFVITPDNQELAIGYRKINESIRITRTGVGAGDITTKGTVKFLNQDLKRNVLNFQSQDKSVLYNNAGEITINNLVFSLSLDSSSPRLFNSKSDQDQFLSQQVQNQADQILSTFKFTN